MATTTPKHALEGDDAAPCSKQSKVLDTSALPYLQSMAARFQSDVAKAINPHVGKLLKRLQHHIFKVSLGAIDVMVCGPAGSGKSTWINRMVADTDPPLLVGHQALCVTQVPIVLKYSEHPYAHAVYDIATLGVTSVVNDINDMSYEDPSNLLEKQVSSFQTMQQSLQQFRHKQHGTVKRLIFGYPWKTGPRFQFIDVNSTFGFLVLVQCSR